MGRTSRLACLLLTLTTTHAHAAGFLEGCRALWAQAMMRPKPLSGIASQQLIEESAQELRHLREELLDLDPRLPIPDDLRGRLLNGMHRYLAQTGQPVELRVLYGRPGLILTPAKSPTNRFQKTIQVLKDRFGVDVAYEPTFMRGGKGVFLLEHNKIMISPWVALEENFGTLVHETAHASTARQLRAGQSSPFYGIVEGAVPYISSDRVYAQTFVFDEMRAYGTQMHHLQTEVKRNTGAARGAAVFLLQENAQKGFELSKVARQIVRDVQRVLKQERAVPVWTVEARTKQVSAVIEIDGAHGLAPAKVTIPLVNSQGVGDPLNLEKLLRQLHDTELEAEKKIKEFQKVIKAFPAA